MVAPAVPAAIATLVGVWTGVWFPWPLFAARMVAVTAWALAVAAAARGGRPAVVASLLVAGFWASGVLLGTTRSQAAAETPLARWFAEQSGADVGRVGPVWLEGRLRADASPTDYGAALDLAAMWVGSPGPGRSVSGGLRLSVGGELAATRIAEWRAGRIIRVSATLRAPPAYRNPGQPDQERRRALGGTVLLGSVKSALLVDVVRRGSVTAELAARVRAWVRRGVDRAVGRHGRAVGRHRHRGAHRRPGRAHGPRRRHHHSASRRRDLSRDCDFRRQYRDSGRPAAAARSRRRVPPASCLPRGHSGLGGLRVRGRRGRLRRPRHGRRRVRARRGPPRPSHPVDQRDGGRGPWRPDGLAVEPVRRRVHPDLRGHAGADPRWRLAPCRRGRHPESSVGHRVRRLAVAALSHGDPDHAGGLGAVLRDFRPHEVWDGVAVLLPGDIGRDVEGAVVASLRPAPFRIVKVPHHGSAGSSTPGFVAALGPCLAIVSAGRTNPFGHPAPDVVERYREAGALVLEIARAGAITVETDGNAIQVRTESGRHFEYRAGRAGFAPLPIGRGTE